MEAKEIIGEDIHLISEERLIEVFANANFGSMTKRDVVNYSVLKCAAGYCTGYTAKVILEELGLVTKKWQLTKFGKEYLYAAFSNSKSISH